jgi:hypothetical protein
MSGAAIGLLTFVTAGLTAQQDPDRFWLAGRYDGNRVIVYFDAVQFKGTLPKSASPLAGPIADAFFYPVRLPTPYVRSLQNHPGAERFSLGDRYDVLLGNGASRTVTITTLVGFESDEQVGNDSYIGALGSAANSDAFVFTRNYYAVRRHVNPPKGAPAFNPDAPVVGVDPHPLPFDVQTRIVGLLTEKMRASEEGRRVPGDLATMVATDRFTLADGSQRYYVRAEWRRDPTAHGKPAYAFAAWLAPSPALRILAVETTTANDDFTNEFPILENVVDLGNGATGLIVTIWGGDGRSLSLIQYADGMNIAHMRHLHSISAGE